MLRQLLLGAALLAALPAAAYAQEPTYTYDVAVDGTFTWSFHQAWSDSASTDTKASIRLQGDLPGLRFNGGRLIAGGRTESGTSQAVSYSEITNDDQGVQRTCTGDSGRMSDAGMFLMPNFKPLSGVQLPRDMVFAVEGFEFDAHCDHRDEESWDETAETPASRKPIPGTMMSGAFAELFHLPAGAYPAERVVYRFASTMPAESCPGYEPEATIDCTMRGEGTLTFTQVGKEGSEPEPDPDDTDDLLAPVVPKEVEIRKDASRMSGMVTCRVRCDAELKASPRKRGKARPRAVAAANRVLASVTERLEAGTPTRMSLSFDRAERAVIRRAGGLRLKLTVRPAKGPGAPLSRTVDVAL